MTDRELLEAAAKAAGVKLWAGGDPWRDSMGCGLLLASGVRLWNPLVDDGDALRLAVALSSQGHTLNIYLYNDEVTVFGPGEGFLHKYQDDPCAATRRALVYAAADLATA